MFMHGLFGARREHLGAKAEGASQQGWVESYPRDPSMKTIVPALGHNVHNQILPTFGLFGSPGSRNFHFSPNVTPSPGDYRAQI